MNQPTFWTLWICVSAPIALLLLVFLAWRWQMNRKAERVPVAEKLLRPAGESLRQRIDVLNEKLGDWLFFTFAIPGGTSAAILLSNLTAGPGYLRWTAALVIGVGTFAFCVIRLFRVVRELRDCRLGFHGERAVGEELNQLMREGCRVFHDVPMEPYGNIDHVIVAPAGVFAVETKTRRKRKAPPGKRDHEIIYDGKTLEFPHCRDSHSLEQARQQADRLRGFLGKAVGEPVKVSPILTFPGWFISSRVNADFKVLNPKGVRAFVLNCRDPVITPQLMERIAYQLDQRCRDVQL